MAGGPIIRRLDDPGLEWQRVKAQRNADGTESSVWEKWFAFRADPPYLSLYARYDPGMVVRRHGHRSPQVVFVLEGEILVGDEVCGAGAHIELPEGEQFGAPRRRGRRMCPVRGDAGRPAQLERRPGRVRPGLCSARGVTPLPDPEIDFPDWLEDERGRWTESLQESSHPEDRTRSVAGSEPKV